jgi:hypothetical protein
VCTVPPRPTLQEHIARIVTEHRVAIQFDQNWLEDLHEKIVAEMFGACRDPPPPNQP